MSVTVPRPLWIVAFADALLSWTKKTSSCCSVGLHSSIVSPMICTPTVRLLSRSRLKVSVPLVATKSPPATADPATSVQSTVTSAVVGGPPARRTAMLRGLRTFPSTQGVGESSTMIWEIWACASDAPESSTTTATCVIAVTIGLMRPSSMRRPGPRSLAWPKAGGQSGDMWSPDDRNLANLTRPPTS